MYISLKGVTFQPLSNLYLITILFFLPHKDRITAMLSFLVKEIVSYRVSLS